MAVKSGAKRRTTYMFSLTVWEEDGDGEGEWYAKLRSTSTGEASYLLCCGHLVDELLRLMSVAGVGDIEGKSEEE